MMFHGAATGPFSPGNSANVSAIGEGDPRGIESRNGPSRSVSHGSQRPQSVRSTGGTESVLSSSMGQGQNYQVQVHQGGQGGQLPISACGRTHIIDMRAAQSIADLQGTLQRTLQMEGQSFHFFDVNGTSLVTDFHVQEAVSSGLIPLSATLSDASIHYMENRREELAQMQWKLVRDQMTGATGKIAAVTRKVDEFAHQMDLHKKELAGLSERFRAEMHNSIENERDLAQLELRQLSERVNAVAQLVNSERNKREVSVQSVEKQVIGMRDMFENERDTRRQDLTVHMTMLQDFKAQIEDAKIGREALEDKHAFEISGVTEKIDMVSRHYADMLQDQVLAFKKCTEEVNSGLLQQNRQVIRLRGEAESNLVEAQSRFSEVEERCGSLENRFSEAASRQAASLDLLSEQHERVSQAVDTLRLDEKEHKGQVQSAIDRVKDLESTLAAAEGETREMVLRERQSRDDQLKRTQNTVISEQTRQISDLEKKFAERLERESTERERNVTDLVTDVSRRLQDRPSAQGTSQAPKIKFPAQAQVPASPMTIQVIPAHQHLSPPSSMGADAKSPRNSVAVSRGGSALVPPPATAQRGGSAVIPAAVSRGGSAIVPVPSSAQQQCASHTAPAAVQYQQGAVRQVPVAMPGSSFVGHPPSVSR